MRRKAAYRHALEIALFAVLLFCVMPRRAYAATYVADGGSDKLVVVLEFLGYDPYEGESTSQLRTAFVNAMSNTAPYVGFTRFKQFYDSVYSLNNAPTNSIQYWSSADGFQYANLLDGAREEATEIRNLWLLTNGQGNGGGSGDGGIGQSGTRIVFDAYKTIWFVTQDYWTGIWYDDASGTVEGAPEPLVVKVPKAQMDSVRSYLGDNFRCCLHIANSNGNSTSGNIFSYYVTFFDTGATYQMGDENTYTNGGYNVTYSKACVGDRYASINDGAIVFDSVSFSNSSSGTYSNLKICYWSDVHYPSDGGGTVTNPTMPPTSDPVEPAPTEPTYNTNLQVNVMVFTSYEIKYLTDHNYTADLSGVVAVLTSIRAWLYEVYKQLNIMIDRFRLFIQNNFNSLLHNVNLIAQNQLLFYQHVNDLFEHTWYVLTHLGSGTNVDVDDTNIVTWLQMIYGRLVQWPTTKPPIDNPAFTIGDILKWFADQWNKLIDALFGVTPTILQNLLGSLSDLSGKFPISIPWDLMALLALFQHMPVTPVFDIPLAWSATGSTPLHVDLTPYDGVASVVRTVILVMFAAGLAWMTPSMYKTLHDVGEVS